MAGSPATQAYNEAGNTDSSRKTVDLLAGWPTAQSRDGDGRGSQAKRADGARMNLDDYAMLAGWTTPAASDALQGGTTQGNRNDPNLSIQTQLAGWMSPGASDGDGGKGPRIGVSPTGQLPDGSKVHMDLSAQAKLLAGWYTPKATDGTRRARRWYNWLTWPAGQR